MFQPLRISAIMAICGGVLLAGAETAINWGQWQWWPWWLVDFVAAAILIVAAIGTLRSATWGALLLTAGWGFSLGMGWMSLSGNWAEGVDVARQSRVAGFYIPLLIFGLSYSFLGLVLSLSAKCAPSRQ